jgi:DNA-binding NarL/FixJ family response regulator
MRGDVAHQRPRNDAANPNNKPGCSSNPKSNIACRHRNGAAASDDEPPSRRQVVRIRDMHDGKADGAVTVTRMNGVHVLDKPIVVIDQRVLARDCLVKCLGEAIADRRILAFARASDWLAVADDQRKPGVVLLCVPTYRRSDRENDEFRILKAAGDVPCIVVSDAEDCDQAVSAIEDGAQGFLPASVSLDVAVQAVRLVEAGGTFIPAKMLIQSQRVREGLGNGGDNARRFTVRQSAVLAALRQGRSNKQIAYQLQMSEGTVKVHVREIMKKVNARNRTEVVLRTHQYQDSQSAMGSG